MRTLKSSAHTGSPSRVRLIALVGFGLGIAALLLVLPASGSPRGGRAEYQQHPELRGRSLPSLRLRDGSERSLLGVPHVVHVFSSKCTFCVEERALIARMLSVVDSAAVITASVDDDASVDDYWSDLPDSTATRRPAPPVLIDPTSLASAGLPSEPPLLLFITPDGRVSDVITGSVASWTPTTLRKRLVVASLRKF